VEGVEEEREPSLSSSSSSSLSSSSVVADDRNVASVDCVSIEDGPSLSEDTSSYSSTTNLRGVYTLLPDLVVVTYVLSVSG
jgi:hypothetical protein